LIDRALRNRDLQRLFLAGILCVLFCLPAFGLGVPERPEGRVTDRTGTLNRDQIHALEKKLTAFEKETTNQIAVLLIPSLEGDSLEDYSIRLAEKWKIGQQGRNNGVILLIVKNDRKLRIEVGYGLEGALPDALAGTIIRNEISPRFREGQFYQGGMDSFSDCGCFRVFLHPGGIQGPQETIPFRGIPGMELGRRVLVWRIFLGRRGRRELRQRGLLRRRR